MASSDLTKPSTGVKGTTGKKRWRLAGQHRCHAVVWKGLMHFRCKLISVASWSGKGDPDMMKALGTWSPAPYLDVTAVDREEASSLSGVGRNVLLLLAYLTLPTW